MHALIKIAVLIWIVGLYTLTRPVSTTILFGSTTLIEYLALSERVHWEMMVGIILIVLEDIAFLR